MDSPPRKINPDSPKEICVKLMLSRSGIWGESWHDGINPLTAPEPREKSFQSFLMHIAQRKAKQRWVLCTRSGAREEVRMSGEEVLLFRGFPTWLHWICHWRLSHCMLAGNCHRGERLLILQRTAAGSDTPATQRVIQVPDPGPQGDFYLMLRNLFPAWASESRFMLLGAFSLLMSGLLSWFSQNTKNFC